jgi:hypothetical protein
MVYMDYNSMTQILPLPYSRIDKKMLGTINHHRGIIGIILFLPKRVMRMSSLFGLLKW